MGSTNKKIIERKSIHSPDEILSFLSKVNGHDYVEINGERIRLTSLKYPLFLTKGTQCVQCGLTLAFCALERDKPDSKDTSPKEYRLSFYGIDLLGREILLTRDHVIARANNGPDILENLQTMCRICNTVKGCT